MHWVETGITLVHNLKGNTYKSRRLFQGNAIFLNLRKWKKRNQKETTIHVLREDAVSLKITTCELFYIQKKK